MERYRGFLLTLHERNIIYFFHNNNNIDNKVFAPGYYRNDLVWWEEFNLALLNWPPLWMVSANRQSTAYSHCISLPYSLSRSRFCFLKTKCRESVFSDHSQTASVTTRPDANSDRTYQNFRHPVQL